ncbi:MAG: hypothetical protein EAZ92_14990 [Candidatus Kapaibacterium sp.]|nr:MAG: hypothetical protein EAZ92_14990 [Candidatus Kapabacteria bacterium]
MKNGYIPQFEATDLLGAADIFIGDFSVQQQRDIKHNSFLSVIKQVQKSVFERATKLITFTNPIIFYNGEIPVIYPNTIVVVSAKTGRYKTQIAEMLCSVLLRHPDSPKSLLNFTANTEREYAVLYVDTERNLSEQLPYSIQQIRERAGYSRFQELANFDCISLLQTERSSRLFALKVYLEDTRHRYKDKHLFVVLDVVTDCCTNFNDVRESMPLVDEINTNINQFDITFLCVIHQNPSAMDDKSRGHLGTELENKASTVLTLAMEKGSQLLEVSCKKQRSTAPFQTLYARYSEQEHGLILASQTEVLDFKRQGTVNIQWNEVFARDSGVQSEELVNRLCAMYGFSKTQARRYMSNATKEQIIAKSSTAKRAPYVLVQSPTDETQMFSPT